MNFCQLPPPSPPTHINKLCDWGPQAASCKCSLWLMIMFDLRSLSLLFIIQQVFWLNISWLFCEYYATLCRPLNLFEPKISMNQVIVPSAGKGICRTVGVDPRDRGHRTDWSRALDLKNLCVGREWVLFGGQNVIRSHNNC